MKILEPVGALGCVGADEVLAVLTEADDRRREHSTALQLGEFQGEAPAPPVFRGLHVGSSDESR